MFELVTSSLVIPQKAELIKAFCEQEGLVVKHLIDQRYVMTKTKGRSHPAFGFVVLSPTGDVLLDIYDVVHYVEEQGLKQC